MKIKRSHNTLFYLVLLSPAALLLLLLCVIGIDLFNINAVDPVAVHTALQDHLAIKQPESFPLPEDAFVHDAAVKTVYIFGESSLVISDGGTFPDYLGQGSLNLQVVNFGISGIDSSDIRLRVAEALAVARPDVLVLYYGHNDYNNAYQGYIIPRYFQQFTFLLKLSYLFRDRNSSPGVLLPDDAYWFSRLKRPQFVQLFETWGLIRSDSLKYEPINQLLLSRYIRNTAAILDMAAAVRVPVVLITPVGNLHAEPFGDLSRTRAFFEKGLSTKDYLQSLRYLKEARDAEIFTYDLRAKTPLIDYIRNLKRPQVYVLDLEQKLEDMHFGFGYEEFLDYFHFNDRSHRLVAEIISDVMVQNGLVGQRSASKIRQVPARR